MIRKDINGMVGYTHMFDLGDGLLAKYEMTNPSGSIKDRLVKYIFDKAEMNGQLKRGDTVIEATSGNTGIAIAMFSAARGYKAIIILPRDMSEERKAMIRKFGAEVIEVGVGDFVGAVALRDKMVAETGAFTTNQFNNELNVDCHELGTGREILSELPHDSMNISALICAAGTGGTFTGTSKMLRKRNEKMARVLVEVDIAQVYARIKAGLPYDPSLIHPHPIQGVSDGMLLPLINPDNIDEVMLVSSNDALEMADHITKTYGLFIGPSSGLNIVAARRWIKNNKPTGKVITIISDGGVKYLSM